MRKCCKLNPASRVSTDKLRLWSNANPGSATEAAISLNPSRSYQESLRAAAVPARGGYTAVSIDDYSRISSKRDEFLNFLLLPNPEGIPAIQYAGLRVA